MRRVTASLAKTALAVVLVLPPLTVTFAQSESPRVIAKGYDPVAYFTDGKPVKGKPNISLDWDEGRYYFANARNKATFSSDPDRYAPRFTGYCTGSMSVGKSREGDPEAWKIVDGKLYLFGSLKWRDEELPNKPDTYAKAQDNWQARSKK